MPRTGLFVVPLFTIPETVPAAAAEIALVKISAANIVDIQLSLRCICDSFREILKPFLVRVIDYPRGLSDIACRIAGVGAPPVRLSISAITRAASISSARFISS